MVRWSSWLVLAAALGGCPIFSDEVMDGFIGGDTAGGDGVQPADCVQPLLELGPAVPLDVTGRAWVHLAPGVRPEIQVESLTRASHPALLVDERVAADGSTVTFFHADPGFTAGTWTARVTWPLAVVVLDPVTLEPLSTTTFCTDGVTRSFEVGAATGGADPSVASGAWWLRQGEEAPDGRLLTRLIDAGAAPGGRALAFDVSGTDIVASTRLRTAGLPRDGCDPSDPVESLVTDGAARWQADTIVLTDREDGEVVLRDVRIDLPTGFDSTRLVIHLAATVDLRAASAPVRALACDTWAPEAGLACGGCPDDAEATACLPLQASGLTLERPPLGDDATPAECP